MGQLFMMYSIVCILLQSQMGDGSVPILCRKYLFATNFRPIRLRFTHAFLGRSQPVGFAEGSGMYPIVDTASSIYIFCRHSVAFAVSSSAGGESH